MIPFLDLGAPYRELKAEIDTAIHRVLDSGWYILGPEAEVFEAEWAAYCGADHAYRRCQQFLLCLHGSCRVLLDDGTQRCEVTLDRPDIGIFMPEMIWGTQYRYSPGVVLLVFSSRPYEADDYLRTYDEFLNAVMDTAL